MVAVRFERVTALPTTAQPNTQYLVKSPGARTIDWYVSGNDAKAYPVNPPSLPGLQPTNDTTSRTAEFNALGLLGGFVLAPGSYSLEASPAVTDTLISGVGAKLEGPAYPPGVAYGPVINEAGSWNARATTNGFANYTVSNQMVAYPSGSHTRSFESAATLNVVVMYDDSTYSSDGDKSNAGIAISARDYVADDASLYAAGGLNLKHMRGWGCNRLVRIGTDPSHNGTVDGTFTTAEGRIDNWGADSGWYQTATNKNIYCAFAGGNKMSTSGYYLGLAGTFGQAGVYHGFSAESRACRDFAFVNWDIPGGGVEQNALWGVLPGGAMEMKAGTAPDTPTTKRVRIYFDTTDNTLKAKFPSGVSQPIAGPLGYITTGIVQTSNTFRAATSTAADGVGFELGIASGTVGQLLAYNRTTNLHIPVQMSAQSFNFAFGTTADKSISFGENFGNYASEAAAAAAGVPVGGLYRTGTTLQIRVS